MTDDPKPRTVLRVDAQREHVEERDYDPRLVLRMWPWVRRHGGLFGVAFLSMPVAAWATAYQPRVLKQGVEVALSGGTSADVRRVIVLFGSVIAVEFVSRLVQTYALQLGGQRATADLRRDLFAHVQTLSVGYFDRTPIGRIVTRLTNDIDGLLELFASGAITAVADVLLLVSILVTMVQVDAELAGLTMLSLPVLGYFINRFRKSARQAFRSIRVYVAELNTYLSEQVQGLAVTQAYGREAECAAEYDVINAEHRDANFTSIRYDALLYSVVESIAVATTAILLFYVARRMDVIEGTAAQAATVGTFVAFYDAIQRFFVPVRDLSMKYTILQSALASIERIVSLLDVGERDAPDLPAARVEVAPDVAIAFQGVEFGYRRDLPVLHGVSFSVRRGERVAIVGATGSGKTTTLSLLLRFYEPLEGTVVVDGEDVRAVPAATLRRKFSVVPQDVFLFRGTVLQNVTIGAEVVDRSRAAACIARVAGDDFLASRGGLEAEVSERGQNLSAGERQLVALARALYVDAPFLLLDEATANVDSETEARLDRAASEALAGRTSIVVAHRLSTVRKADRILVFHHGRIVEEGDHATLLAQNGVYARLHRLQFGG